jgi:hypothetical protein
VRWGVFAAVVFVAAGAGLHWSVRRAMGRRGVRDWRWRDSVGAFPLSIMGAAAALGSLVAVRCGAPVWVAGVGVVVGVGWMSFGARAWVKLTR